MAKEPKAEKAPKLTKAAAGANLTPETYLDYRGRCGASYTKLLEAQSFHQAEMKRAKAAGIDTKAMAVVMKQRKQDPDELAMFKRNKLRYAGWEGMPHALQQPLFGTTDDQHPTDKAAAEFKLHRAEDDGRFAGRDGTKREQNPNDPGSEAHSRWDTGWMATQAEFAAVLGENATKAGTQRKRREPGGDQPAA
jgi:hypothetical protein